MSYYITTPIYYVNGEPHLGHAYTTVAADVLARHMRQRGEDVFFLTGTDEHGEPVAQAAEKLGITPRELGDSNAVRFKELAGRARTSPTTSSSAPPTPSTWPRSREVVQRIHDNGHVYAGHYEGWYCPRCADFKTESELERGQQVPDPPDRAGDARRRTTGSSGCPPSRSHSSASTPSDPDFVMPAGPLQRGARPSSRGGCATSRSAGRGSSGACRSRGTTRRSSTSGSTRCSTTTRRSPTRATART